MFKNLSIFVLLLTFLVGCASEEEMDANFYAEIEQPSKDYGEAIDDLGILIRVYDSNQENLHISDWQEAILKVTTELDTSSKKLYSITTGYCPNDEEVFCDEIETLYLKTRDLSGSLTAAANGNSHSQVREVIKIYTKVLAHLDSMSR